MTTTSATSTTATQSLVTALGAGSGIDMAALANNLATAQFASRIDRLTTKSETLTAQISSASNIKAMLLNFTTSLGDAVRNGGLSPQPSVANPSVATASLSGTRQPSGTFSLEVTALAKSQTLASAAYGAATDTVGAGTLKLCFGTVADGAFNADTSQAAVDIAIPADATLSDVASAINAKNTSVTAYVATTPTGAQLVLKGKEGANSGFVLEATENPDTPGLSKLAWTPGSTGGQLLQTAGDAAFKVDGLPRTASSNTVSEAIPGVTLKLTAINAGAPTNVTFADTSAAITGAMTDLTGALNEIAGAVNKATDPQSGELRSDGGARTLRRNLSQLAGNTVMPNAKGATKTLADLGLSTQRDGTFVLDTARLKATISKDPDGVAAMFTNGLYGVYGTIDKLYRSASTSTDSGSLGGSITRFTKQLKDVGETQSELAIKQEALRANLTARYAVSDSRINASKSTLTFLQNQIAAWNKSD